MDELENIVVPEIHEKCLHASGALMVWVGATDEYNVLDKPLQSHDRSFKYLSGGSMGGLDNKGCSCMGRSLDVRTTQWWDLCKLCEDTFRQVS